MSPLAYKIPPASWSPIQEHDGSAMQLRLQLELDSWVGTPYMIGQQVKGVGVDCARFVGAILDFMGGTRTPLELIPPDACFHDPALATRALDKFRHLFRPMSIVRGWAVQPGDVMVTGPVGGGPGHGIVVGCAPGTLYEAGSFSVQKTGFAIPSSRRVFGVYRKADRLRWSA